MSAATRVELQGISAGYSDGKVLHDITLSAPAGDLLALLGPSGCGKTTLLRVIAGLIEPVNGELRFDGALMNRIPPEERRLAMVFQKPLLFPHLNVEGNVGFGLRMRGVTRGEIRRRIDNALDLVRLEGFGERKATELSGGQEQRVALARALVTDPRVLLLDEPFAALDEELRAEMRELVRGLQQRLGITTVFVTHDRAEAARIADRVALMLNGRLEQEGTVGDLVRRPSTAAVGKFFGWRVWKCDRGMNVYYRPEDARVIPSSEEGADSGTITSVLDTGTDYVITVALRRGETVEVRQRTYAAATGDRVIVAVPDEALRTL